MEASKIRAKRKSLGFTQKDLAIKLGVSGNTIINWERGDKIPESKIQILNKFLNETIENFFGFVIVKEWLCLDSSLFSRNELFDKLCNKEPLFFCSYFIILIINYFYF